MANAKRFITYLFLFIIPYGLAILLIGTAYNALVIHWSSRWRLLVGAVVGMIFMNLLKIIIQKPLKLLASQNESSVMSHLMHFFFVDSSKVLLTLNLLLDMILTIVGIYASRLLFTPQFITGTALGWLIVSLFVSAMIGAYFAFDQLKLGEPVDEK